MTTRGNTGTPADTERGRWRAFAVCLVAAFMTLLDVSIVNVALPSIRTGLHASQTQLQWIVSGYALAFGLALVPAGRLGDVRGRRTMFVLSLSLFTVASAACGLAPSAGWLVAARLVQGVAGGMLNPQVSGLVQELFRGAERGRAFGLQGATIGISTAVGPLAGGVLIALFGAEHGWRSVFFVNVPIGVVAVLLAWRLLPRPVAQRGRGSLDPVGVLLLGAGILLVLLPVVESSSRSGGGGLPWYLALVAVPVLAAFVWWERRHDEPMVDLRLFRRLSYAYGVAVGMLYFAGFTAIFFVVALYLQSGLGYDALASGLAITPFAAGSAVASFLAGRVVNRIGRPLVAAGLAVVVVGLVATALAVRAADGHSVGAAAAIPLLIAGLGSGAVIAPNVTLTLSEVPVEQGGTAGGVLQTFQRIGAAIGIAVVGRVFFGHIAGQPTSRPTGQPTGQPTGRPDWTGALDVALWVCAATVAVALVVALVDVLSTGRRERRT